MTLKSVETLLDVLQFADSSHTAVIVPELGIRVSYDSLRQQVLAMANALASVGIRRGDAVAIALPNGLPAIVSFLAATIAGKAAPLNLAYPYEEFLFFLNDTNARILLCPPAGAEFARSAASDRKIPVFPVGMSEDGNVWLAGNPTGATAKEPTPDDIALVLHTSGSTGRPKRVPLRHFNLAVSSANIANCLRSLASRRFLVHHAAVSRSRIDGLADGDTAFGRHGGCSDKIQRAFFLADGSRASSDLVFGSSDDASASACSRPPKTRRGCDSTIHPFV